MKLNDSFLTPPENFQKDLYDSFLMKPYGQAVVARYLYLNLINVVQEDKTLKITLPHFSIIWKFRHSLKNLQRLGSVMLWLLRILRSGTSNLIDSGAILRRHIGVTHVSMRSVDNNIFICATSRCASATQKKHQIIYNCTNTYSEFPPALNIFYDLEFLVCNSLLNIKWDKE